MLAERSSPRRAGALAVLDCYFPILWIVFYALLPVSGWADVMFDYWFDQKRDLDALKSVLATGRSDAIDENVIGPAYIAAAALVRTLTRLSPEDSLVVLARISYVLSVAGGLVLVRIFIRRTASAPPSVSLAAQLLFVVLVCAGGTWYWSDVPWSHFFAVFLGVALFVLRYAFGRIGPAASVLVGVVVALLALTRTFELVALVLAWLITLALLWLSSLYVPRRPRSSQLLWGGGALVATVAAVYVATGKSDAFFLYENHLDRQSGSVEQAEVAETPTFSPGFVPIKLVQLFVEPCYFASCGLADYVDVDGETARRSQEPSGQRLWRPPLAVQLPALVFLPFCLAVVAGVAVWCVRHRKRAEMHIRSLRLLAEMTIAATGIVLGYAANTMTGSPHLRYGFARDFLLPATLTAIVAVCLGSAGIWLALTRLRRASRPSSELVFVSVAIVGMSVLVAGVATSRDLGLPRLDRYRLESVAYTSDCRGDLCRVMIAAKTVAGRPISIPEPSTLTFGCGSDEPRFTIYVERPTEGVRLGARSCAEPRLVAAWPTVMGLPPGSRELRAISVANA